MVNEPIKSRVFSEYFSMIADLVLVADVKFTIIHNNYSHKIRESLINKLNKQQTRFNMLNIMETNPSRHIKLDQCFNAVEREQLQCGEETINNLIKIFNVIGYRSKKHVEEEMNRFRDSQLLGILKTIEDLENNIKSSNNQSKKSTSSRFNNPNKSKIKSSVRTIYVKRNYPTVNPTYSEHRSVHP